MTPQRFHNRPVEIEAVKWSGAVGEAHPIIQWVNGVEGNTAVWREYRPYSSGGLFPQTAQDRIDEGIYLRRDGSWEEQYVGPADYVIRSAAGTFAACKGTLFEQTYEATDE